MFTNVHAQTLLYAIEENVLCQNRIPAWTAWTRGLDPREHDVSHEELTVDDVADRPPSFELHPCPSVPHRLI